MSVEAPAMRVNLVRQRLRAGGNAFGVMAFEFFTPGLAPVFDNKILGRHAWLGIAVEMIKIGPVRRSDRGG